MIFVSELKKKNYDPWYRKFPSQKIFYKLILRISYLIKNHISTCFNKTKVILSVFFLTSCIDPLRVHLPVFDWYNYTCSFALFYSVYSSKKAFENILILSVI